jgi:hypothetical protein
MKIYKVFSWFELTDTPFDHGLYSNLGSARGAITKMRGRWRWRERTFEIKEFEAKCVGSVDVIRPIVFDSEDNHG